MCVILVGSVKKELHEAAKTQNKDGFSLFTREQGLIKAPTAEQVKKALGTFGIWHYRIASSGGVSKANIHPFLVAQGKAYLYHNGIIGGGDAGMSDTACLAKMLEHSPVSTVKSVLQSLSQNGKGRFLLANVKNPMEFYTFGNWECEAGVLLSHPMYVGSKYSYAQKAGWVTRDGSCYPRGTFTRNLTNYKNDEDSDADSEDG